MSEESDLTLPQIYGLAHADDATAMSNKAELAEKLQAACEYVIETVPGYVSSVRSQWSGRSSDNFTHELDDIDKSVSDMNNTIRGYPKGITNIASAIRTFQDETDSLAKEYEQELGVAADSTDPDSDFDAEKAGLREKYNKRARSIMQNTVEYYQSVNSDSIMEPAVYDAIKSKNAPSARPAYVVAATTIAVGVFATKASKLGPAANHAMKKNGWHKFEKGITPDKSTGFSKLGHGVGDGIKTASTTDMSYPSYTAPNLQSSAPSPIAPSTPPLPGPAPQLQSPAPPGTIPAFAPMQPQPGPTPQVTPNPTANGKNRQRSSPAKTPSPGPRPQHTTPPTFGPNSTAKVSRPAFPTPHIDAGKMAAHSGTAANGAPLHPANGNNPGSSAPRTPGMGARPTDSSTPPPRPGGSTKPTQQVSMPPRTGAPGLGTGAGNNAPRPPAAGVPHRSGSHVTVGSPRGNGTWGRDPWARKTSDVNHTKPIRRATVAPKTTSSTWGNNPWARRPTPASVSRVSRRPAVRPSARVAGEATRGAWGRNPWVRPDNGNMYYPSLRTRKRKDEKEQTEANVYDSQAEVDADEAAAKEEPLSGPALSRLLAQASPHERQRIIAIEAKKLGIEPQSSPEKSDGSLDDADAKQTGQEPTTPAKR